MSAYKSFVFAGLILLAASSAFAVETVFHTISIGYFQWQERMELSSSSGKGNTVAQFFGNSFGYERESYNLHWGNSLQLEGYLGQGNGGRPGAAPAYNQTFQSFFGGSVAYKWAYRPSGYISLLSGPFVLYRGMKWPEESGVTAKSGSDINVGVLFEAKIRPSQRIEIYQKIGMLGIKASGFFAAGLGMKF